MVSAAGWLLLLLAIYVLAVRSSRPADRFQPIAGSPRSSPLPQEAIPNPGKRVEVEAVSFTNQERPPIAPNDPPTVAHALELDGALIDDATQAPIAGATIALSYPINSRNAWERDKYPKPLEALTDEDGAFHLSASSDQWNQGGLYYCSATLQDALLVFSGFVSLQERLLLRGILPAIARGRLLSFPGFPYTKTSVRLAPSGGNGYTRATLDDNGLFEALVPLVSLSDSFELCFTQAGVRGCFRTNVTAASLLADPPVVVNCFPATLSLTCTTEDGRPIDSAIIHVGATGMEPPSIEDYLSDSGGSATFLIDEGENEICVAKEGYWTYLDIVSFPQVQDAFHEVTLIKKDATNIIHGRASLPDGSPVARAFVSCVPMGRVDGVSLANFASGYTDDDGRYHLISSFSGSCQVKAFYRKHGFSEAKTVSGTGAFAELVFRSFGSISIEVVHTFEPEDFLSGMPEYHLVDQYNHRSFSGYCQPPITMSDVPEGHYNLYVRLPGEAGYICTSLAIVAGQEKRATANVDAGMWQEGQVVSSDGSTVEGLTVQVLNPNWPDEVSRAWGVSKTDRIGLFKVFSGRERLVDVKIGRKEKSLGVFSSVSGTYNRFSIP